MAEVPSHNQDNNIVDKAEIVGGLAGPGLVTIVGWEHIKNTLERLITNYTIIKEK